MHRRTLAASAGMLVSGALLLVLCAAPVSIAAANPVSPGAPFAPTANLAPALAPDGMFQGAPGVEGTVDPASWTLLSNLAVGEAPRFAPVGIVSPPSLTDTWTALGSNGAGNGALNLTVKAIAVSGSDVYVGGWFTNVAGIPEADYVAKWDGASWSALGSNGAGNGALNLYVNALAIDGGNLYVGGDFSNAAGIPEADNIAKWDGSTWSALGSDGAGDGAFGINGYIDTIAVYKGNVYAGGGFNAVRGLPLATGIVKFNGSSWSTLGTGMFDGSVSSLVVSGGYLYVGGGFAKVNGVPATDNIARWDGSGWEQLGSNAAGGAVSNVYAIAVDGSDVYAGGAFANAGGHPEADYVAKWNRSTGWSALGSNGAGNGALNQYVYGLAMRGHDLYVAGDFFDAGGVPAADSVAKWNGSSWSALGSKSTGDGAFNGAGRTLVFSGNDLYAGGGFQNVGGNLASDFVAKWTISAPSTPTLTYTAGAGGSIVGSATQSIASGSDGTTVTAIPSAGYHFVSWSDGVLTAARRDTSVYVDTAVSASFALDTFSFATTTKLAGPFSVKVKKTLKLTGTVRSALAPGKVTIVMTRLVGKKWKSAGSVRVSVKAGSYSYSFKPKYKGSWRFVATYTGGVVGVTTYKASKSATKTVKVK